MKRKRKKRIAFDALGIDSASGARTAVYYLIKEVIKLCPDWEFVVFLSKYESAYHQANVKQVVLPLKRGIISRVIMQFLLPFEVLFRRIDLIHFTKSQASVVPRAKTVMTIHDVTILLYPDIHPKSSVLYWKYIQPIMAKIMDAIVAVSNDGARGIKTYLGVPEKKLIVVNSASQFSSVVKVEKRTFLAIQKKYDLPKRYFLVVGQIALKKNLDTLIRAFGILRDRGKIIPALVMVGPRYDISDAGSIFELIDELDLSTYVHYLGSINTLDLQVVFSNAEIFLMPSVHEGFGIPCLEAMQLGVPVIASKASALPEIIGSAGILIEDILSPESWADAITELHDSPDKRIELIKAGKKRARLFSWNNSAKKLISLYEDLLETCQK